MQIIILISMCPVHTRWVTAAGEKQKSKKAKNEEAWNSKRIPLELIREGNT